MEVPVKPRCPTLLEEKCFPELESFSEGVSQPRAQVQSFAIFCFVKNSLIVDGLK